MNVYISSIDGNKQLLDGGAMFGNAPKALWSKWCPPDRQGRIQLNCRSMLIELGAKRVLCELGVGDFLSPDLRDRYGIEPGGNKVLDSLEKRGLAATDIDYIIISHLHFDHIGGLLNSFEEYTSVGRQLLFPNAKIVVGERAFERAKRPHYRDRASFIQGLPELLEESDRLVIVKGDAAREPSLPREISFMYSDGHTPGQMLTIVKGENSEIIFLGDLIPGKPWLHLPISMGYDRFPELIVDEKISLYEKFENTTWFGFFTHDSQCSGAKISKNARGRYVADADIIEFDRFRL